jgi:hypothetical protein
MNPRPKSDASLERWLSVVLRTAHLAGVVWLGAAVVSGQPADPRATALMAASGVALLKLALVVWMAIDARQVGWIFWSLLAASSISSHAPKSWRHWPRPAQVRASRASKPG